MAPSSEKIAELFSHYLKGQLTIFEVAVSDPEFRTFSGNSNLSVNFSDDIKLRVAGQEFELAAQTEGIDELKEYLTTRLAPAILGAIDQSKPMTTEVIPVISGGEGPWAAVEFKATATSKKSEFLCWPNNPQLSSNMY